MKKLKKELYSIYVKRNESCVYRNSETANEVYKQNPLTCGLASYLQND